MASDRVVAVFGGSGRTGREVIRESLRRLMAVRALVRPGSTLRELAPRVHVVSGFLKDRTAITETLDSARAAVCVFGPRPPYREIFCAEATRLIVSEMSAAGVTHMICQTGAMVGDYRENRSFTFEWLAARYRRRRPTAARDRVEQEEAVLRSGLYWTLVKPPRLKDGRPGRRVSVGTGVRVGLLSSVSRMDVARFILDEIERPAHIGEAVFIKN